MLRTVVLLVLVVMAAFAATVRLYMKDGTYQIVREYQVQQDRVRYYSTERGEWEEVPLELVDLKKTEAEIKAREEEAKAIAKSLEEEDKAEREAKKEILTVPPEPGVYSITGGQVLAVKQAESKIVNNKRRSILKAISPVPLVAGKSTVEVDGPHSATVVTQDRPEFYMRLATDERFGMVKTRLNKNNRVVVDLNIIPITKEIMEEVQEVECFRQQVADGVYKIWPMKPIEPGEYAMIEFTEGKGDIQIWDFAYTPKK